ncbi:DNA integrity scanning protein DisA [Trichinella pseudospiralis]
MVTLLGLTNRSTVESNTTQTTRERAENYLHQQLAAVGNNTPGSTLSNGNLPTFYQRDARSTTSSVCAMSLPRTSNRKLENETSRMEATPPVALLILTDPVENVLMKGIEKSSPGKSHNG